jgi:hypothetical protein
MPIHLFQGRENALGITAAKDRLTLHLDSNVSRDFKLKSL